MTTLAPVVVKPDIPSKYASTGLESWSPPSKRYGIDGERGREQPGQRDDEEALADADLPGCVGRRRSSAKPSPLVTTPATTNGRNGSL